MKLEWDEVEQHVKLTGQVFAMDFKTSISQSKAFSRFPDVASDKEPTCQKRRRKRCGFCPWVRKIPWRRKWQRTPVFLPGEPRGQRSLAGYSPWGRIESDATKQLSMHAQEMKTKVVFR